MLKTFHQGRCIWFLMEDDRIIAVLKNDEEARE